MSLFTKEMMWDCAVKQMGTQKEHSDANEKIVLECDWDVEELYNALKLAHDKIIKEIESQDNYY